MKSLSGQQREHKAWMSALRRRVKQATADKRMTATSLAVELLAWGTKRRERFSKRKGGL